MAEAAGERAVVSSAEASEMALPDATEARTEHERAVQCHAFHFIRRMTREAPLLEGAGEPDGGEAQTLAFYSLSADLPNILAGAEGALRSQPQEWLLAMAPQLRRLLNRCNKYRDLEECCAALLVEAQLERNQLLEVQARLGLARALHHLGRYEHSLREAMTAESIADALEDIALVAASWVEQATVLYGRSSFAEARLLYERAFKLTNSLGTGAHAPLGLANCEYCLGNYDDAQRNYEQCLEVYQQRGDRTSEATIICNLGMIEYVRGNFAMARQLLEQSCEVAAELEDVFNYATALNTLGNVVYRMGDMDKAARCYEQALALRIDMGDRRGIAICFNNLGNMAAEKQDYAAAREMYESSLAIKCELGERDGEARCFINLGNMDAIEGKFDAAVQRFDRALQISRAIGERYVIATAHGSLGHIQLVRADWAAARKLYAPAVLMFAELGCKPEMVSVCSGAGAVLLRQGQAQAGALAVLAAKALRAELGFRVDVGEQHAVQAAEEALDAAQLNGELSEADLALLGEQAAALSVEDLATLVKQQLK